MAKVAYPYESVRVAADDAHPQGFIAHRPVLFVTITASNRQSVRFSALLDSGADSCVFPLSLALLLKLDVLSLPKALTSGVGSEANTTYYDHVTIDLGNGLIFKAHAGFTSGMDAIGLGLLGQQGFFEVHHVEFRQSEGIFTVEKI